MDLFALVLTWLWLGTAALPADISHVEAFLARTNFNLKKKYRPLYHITAPFGWLNDPAAFVFYKYKYHLFYQYYPYDGAWGPLQWGHAVSVDLVNWVHYPAALVPKDDYDRHGCLAGSVISYNGYLAVFYTGEVFTANRSQQTQNIAVSADGILFQKFLYNPVVRPSPIAYDFRNPKVWRYQNTWYMMIGASVKGQGQLLLYSSPDLYNWKSNMTIAYSHGDMGYLWESPDIFEIGGDSVLILSARGVHVDGHRFQNVHQTGYVTGRYQYYSASFHDLEVSGATFTELDYGHDFYAAKSALAADGRRVLIAWLGMWDSEFRESDEGWAGAMTLVREVHLGPYGRLLTPPVRETTDLRAEVLEEAWYNPGEAFLAGTKTFELLLNASTNAYDASFSFEWDGLRQYSVKYSAKTGQVSVDRAGLDGERRADWRPERRLRWRVFMDRCSIEVFCGDGEVVFSSRIYPRKSIMVRIWGKIRLHVTQYRLRRSVGYDANLNNYLQTRILAYRNSNETQ